MPLSPAVSVSASVSVSSLQLPESESLGALGQETRSFEYFLL